MGATQTMLAVSALPALFTEHVSLLMGGVVVQEAAAEIVRPAVKAAFVSLVLPIVDHRLPLRLLLRLRQMPLLLLLLLRQMTLLVAAATVKRRMKMENAFLIQLVRLGGWRQYLTTNQIVNALTINPPVALSAVWDQQVPVGMALMFLSSVVKHPWSTAGNITPKTSPVDHVLHLQHSPDFTEYSMEKMEGKNSRREQQSQSMGWTAVLSLAIPMGQALALLVLL